MLWEAVLTAGLVSVILGTASGAQQVGPLAAIGVGSYIALAGLWGAPVSGASMNPARSLGPALVLSDWTAWWAYLAGPAVGGVIAVGIAYVLRGPGGGLSGTQAATGTLGIRWWPGPFATPSRSRRSRRIPRRDLLVIRRHPRQVKVFSTGRAFEVSIALDRSCAALGSLPAARTRKVSTRWGSLPHLVATLRAAQGWLGALPGGLGRRPGAAGRSGRFPPRSSARVPVRSRLAPSAPGSQLAAAAA
jgi:hypothetical protein